MAGTPPSGAYDGMDPPGMLALILSEKPDMWDQAADMWQRIAGQFATARDDLGSAQGKLATWDSVSASAAFKGKVQDGVKSLDTHKPVAESYVANLHSAAQRIRAGQTTLRQLAQDYQQTQQLLASANQVLANPPLDVQNTPGAMFNAQHTADSAASDLQQIKQRAVNEMNQVDSDVSAAVSALTFLEPWTGAKTGRAESAPTGVAGRGSPGGGVHGAGGVGAGDLGLGGLGSGPGAGPTAGDGTAAGSGTGTGTDGSGTGMGAGGVSAADLGLGALLASPGGPGAGGLGSSAASGLTGQAQGTSGLTGAGITAAGLGLGGVMSGPGAGHGVGVQPASYGRQNFPGVQNARSLRGITGVGEAGTRRGGGASAAALGLDGIGGGIGSGRGPSGTAGPQHVVAAPPPGAQTTPPSAPGTEPTLPAANTPGAGPVGPASTATPPMMPGGMGAFNGMAGRGGGSVDLSRPAGTNAPTESDPLDRRGVRRTLQGRVGRVGQGVPLALGATPIPDERRRERAVPDVPEEELWRVEKTPMPLEAQPSTGGRVPRRRPSVG